MTIDERLSSRIDYLRNLQNEGKTIIQMITHLLKKYDIHFIPIIIDTFYHFEEIYQILEKFKEKNNIEVIHIDKAENREDFEKKYDSELWKRQPERYAHYTKVLPLLEMYKKYTPSIVINGRRPKGGERPL